MENISNTFYKYAASEQQMTCLSCGKNLPSLVNCQRCSGKDNAAE